MARHWLMKSEPDSFGIDDLARVKVEPWTGVRNYQARNFMREMKVGDRVLFYHSNATPPGVAGLATVVTTGVVDATQFDPASPYHDPASDPAAPRWDCVEVAFGAKFPALVSLDELRAADGLVDMVVLRKGSRLSVQPVAPAEYAIVVALGRAALKAGDASPMTALAEARLAASRAPGDVLAQLAAAYACDRAGDEPAAIGYYERARDLGVPAAAQRQFTVGYGSTLRNVGRADDAVAILGEAAAVDVDYAPYRAFLALALMSAGHPRAAVATLLGVALDSARPGAFDGFERALGAYYAELLDAALTGR